jgi:hypothetical protein
MGAWRKIDSGIFVPDTVAGAWDRVAKSRYVAHVDMLGMSDLTRKTPKLAWDAVSKMATAKKVAMGISFTVEGRGVVVRDRVADFTFSDTILLFTRGDESDDLMAILIVCLELLAQTLHGSIPVRIGLAHGLFVFNGDEGLFVGPPLVDAHDRGEAAQWIGAVVDGTVAERADKLSPPFRCSEKLPIVVEWDVPIKAGDTARLPVLAWPRSHRRNFEVPTPISVEDFYRPFEQLFGPLANLRAGDRAKYLNTVSFINQMLQTT